MTQLEVSYHAANHSLRATVVPPTTLATTAYHTKCLIPT